VLRWNNTLTVINNPAENGGYQFTSYQWYLNQNPVSNKQSFSAGIDGATFRPSDIWHVELTALNVQGTLRSCQSNIALQNAELKVQPNPVDKGNLLWFETDADTDLLEGAEIEVYNTFGVRVDIIPVQGRQTSIESDRFKTGVYILVLKGKGGFRQETKLVVR
jgi:hypothetical protein